MLTALPFANGLHEAGRRALLVLCHSKMKGAAKVNFHEEFCDGSLSAFFVYLSYRSDQNSQSDGQRASQQPVSTYPHTFFWIFTRLRRDNLHRNNSNMMGWQRFLRYEVFAQRAAQLGCLPHILPRFTSPPG